MNHKPGSVIKNLRFLILEFPCGNSSTDNLCTAAICLEDPSPDLSIAVYPCLTNGPLA